MEQPGSGPEGERRLSTSADTPKERRNFQYVSGDPGGTEARNDWLIKLLISNLNERGLFKSLG
jgi:hypothetical protein